MLALDVSNFIGRFHPVVVHLPIGFLILAVLLEWYHRKIADTWSKLIPYAWLLGALGGIAAIICGWLLAENGGYNDDNLALHRWLGIALVVLSFLGWWIKRNPDRVAKGVHNGINILLLLLLTAEGHWGGNLTHGETYLFEYAPTPLKNLVLKDDPPSSLPDLGTKDSIEVYSDMIQPIFAYKCMACHNNEVQRGGLNMASAEVLQQGGDNGVAIVPNHPTESEIFERVTLSQKSEKYMPPKGEPLTYDEIKAVEWWIHQGAPFDQKIGDMAINEEMYPVLLRLFNLDVTPKPWYETVQLQALDTTSVNQLSQKGFLVKTLATDNPLLDVKFTGNEFTEVHLKALKDVGSHITWLSLGNTGLTDGQLETIGMFSNLTRLGLQETSISDKGVAQLIKLNHLESLNLYGTNVTEACLEEIKQLTSLRRIYLWNTDITIEQAKVLKEDHPDLEIVMGSSPL